MIETKRIERFTRGRTFRRAGFSLITVLLIAMAGTAVLGAILYTFGSFAETSAAVVYKDAEYNAIQNEIEKAKAVLADKMKGRALPMTWNPDELARPPYITSADELVIYDDTDPFGMLSDEPWQHGDKTGLMSVRIYDMQYMESGTAPIPPDHTAAAMTEDEYEAFLADLPAALSLRRAEQADNANPLDPDEGGISSNAAGVYLIRATLTLDSGERARIETAVIQSTGDN